MNETLSSTPIEKYLAEPLVVVEPDVSGPLAVFPLLGPEPRQHYVSFAEARSRGVRIDELEARASVNDLVIQNPAAEPVLLYEGEEVLGAQQNRTFDVTVLVPAGAKLRVPVSCVERGRWDSSRHAEPLAPAPQATYPELRREKNRQARGRVLAGQEARSDQSLVWADIDVKSRRHGVHSQTDAMHDVYEGRRHAILTLSGAIRRRDGQLGALVAIAGRFVILDFVSRADVFAALHKPLVQGYTLDALEFVGTESVPMPPSIEDAHGFVAAATGTGATTHKAVGLGRDLRFAAAGIGGSALVHQDELIQLTAFPDSGRADGSDDGAGRIRRPSRRNR
jgi:hypothetical protein